MNFITIITTAIGWIFSWLIKSGAGAAIRDIAITGLVKIAREVVGEIAAEPGIYSDYDKRQRAFDNISAIINEEGIKAGDSLINLAIEMAVSELKKAES